MWTQPWRLIVPIVLPWLGCGPGSAPSASDTDDTALSSDQCGAPSLEIGVHPDAHQPFEEGGDIVIVHGPQGGWHVDVTGLAIGIHADVEVTGRVVLTDTDEQIAGDQPPAPALVEPIDDGCGVTLRGVRLFVDDVELPPELDSYLAFVCTLADRPLELHVEVAELSTGATVEATTSGWARLDPLDATSLCPGLD